MFTQEISKCIINTTKLIIETKQINDESPQSIINFIVDYFDNFHHNLYLKENFKISDVDIEEENKNIKSSFKLINNKETMLIKITYTHNEFPRWTIRNYCNQYNKEFLMKVL